MMNRELFFATPIYVADVGTPQLNKHLEHHILVGFHLIKCQKCMQH